VRSTVLDLLAPAVRRSLKKLGGDLALARRKRKLTTAMMAERVGLSRSTYHRLEQGDPTVSLGAYAMALFVLGFGTALGDLVDPGQDGQGLLLDAQRVPTRVRVKKEPTAL
jgi:DNA-binding XRE family transcriptional regulator